MKIILGENLKVLRKKKGLNQSELADYFGKGHTTIGNWEKGISEPSLEELTTIANYFEIPVNVLLYEDVANASLIQKTGSRKKRENASLNASLHASLNTVQEPKGDYNRTPKIVTVDRQGNDNTVLVQTRARAGYLNGHEDPEFIQTLPTYRLPGMENGLFRMFEVSGHSMVPTFHESDIVICRYVDNLAEIRDDRVHVVLCIDGLVVKRALNRIQKDGKIILNSDNQRHPGEYPPIVVNPEDILEAWYIVAFISRQMRKPGEIYSRLIDLEGRLTLIEDDRKKQMGK